MDGVCSILGVLGLALLVITLVGHGIWVLLATIARSMTGAGNAAQRRLPCPRCGESLMGEECPSCGWSAWTGVPTLRPQERTPSPEQEARAAGRQIRLLQERGQIDAATCESVIRALEAGPKPLPGRASPTVVVNRSAAPVAPAFTQAAQPKAASAALPLVTPHRVIAIPPAPAPPPQPVAPPPPPRKSRAEILSAFMEESNIRWGELVGGLLIVGCSIALVYTFWEWIGMHPLAKFGIFTAVTSAVFGVGLYTEHRWKLPNTSRGLMIIATLLVPLNFLAIAGLSQPVDSELVVRLVEEGISLGLFGYLLWMAGRVLVPQWSLLLAIGVLGESLAQLAIHRFALPAEQAGALRVAMLAMPPVGGYVAITGVALVRTWRSEKMETEQVNQLFILLGALGFAVILPLGLLAWRCGDIGWTVQRIAPLVSVLGAPAIAAGLLLWQRLSDPKHAGLRTAGTSIGAAGTVLLLGGLVMGWPNPGALLPVALVDFAVLSAVALLFGIPSAHLLALPCAVLAYLLGFHLAWPAENVLQIDWGERPKQLAMALVAPENAGALVGMVVALAGGGLALARRSRQRDAGCYQIVAAAVAGASMVLASWHGLGRAADHGAAWVYLVYAVGAMAVAWVWGKPAAGWVGMALLALACVQGLVYRFPVADEMLARWTVAMLSHASVLAIGLAASGFAVARGRPEFWGTLRQGCLCTSAAGLTALVISLAVADLRVGGMWMLAARALWVAGLWLVVLRQAPGAAMFMAWRVALYLAAALAGIAVLEHRAWFISSAHPLAEPWTLQGIMVALAALTLAWAGMRLVVWRQRGGVGSTASAIRKLLDSPWGDLDRWMTAALLVGLLVMSVVAVAPGIGVELSTQSDRSSFIAADTTYYAHLRGWGCWALLASVSSVLVVSLVGRYTFNAVAGLLLIAAGACALLASRWIDQSASASALRWLLAGMLIAGSIPVWIVQRVRSVGGAMRLADTDVAGVRGLLLAISGIVILAMTIYPSLVMLGGSSLVGAAEGCFYNRIVNAASYITPLAVLIAVLVGYAMTERSPAFALCGGLVLNLTVTLAYALMVVTKGLTFDEVRLVRLAQLNAVAAAGFALAWMIVRGMGAGTQADQEPSARVPRTLVAQVAIGAAAMLLAWLPQEVALFGSPLPMTPATAQAGSALAWAMAVLVGAAVIRVWWQQSGALPVHAIGVVVIVMGSLGALSMGRVQPNSWLGLHSLLLTRAAGAWLILATGWLATLRRAATSTTGDEADRDARGWLADRMGWREFQPAITWWAAVLGAVTVALAMRAAVDDPARPAWTLVGLLAASTLSVALAFWTLRNEWLYGMGSLLCISTTIAWNHYSARRGEAMLAINVGVLAAAGVGGLLLELLFLRPARYEVVPRGLPHFHRVACWVCTAVAAFSGGLWVVRGMAGGASAPQAIDWAAFAGCLVLAIACLGDIAVLRPLCAIYVVGLAILGPGMRAMGWRREELVNNGTMVLAGFSVLMGYLYAMRVRLTQLAEQWGIPLREEWPARQPGWLAPVMLLQTLFVIVMAMAQVLSEPSLTVRLGLAVSAFAMAPAIGLLCSGRRLGVLHRASLMAGLIGAVLWGWAWLPPHGPGGLLDRAVIVMVAAACIVAFYAVGMVKLLRRPNVWTDAARSIVPVVVGLMVASLLFIIVAEAMQAGPTGTGMSTWGIIAVILAFGVLMVVAIICAIVPGRDPMDLSEKGRTAYVYAAEVILAILFLHLRLNYPDLFSHRVFRRYWPFIIVLIAFVGVGLSELFRRQHRTVLSDPLEKTGAFLPLLPVLAYWAIGQSEAAEAFRGPFSYAQVLFLAGLVYGVLALLRKSFLFGLLAALTANGGLCVMLSKSIGLGFMEHPQLWVIPGALCVLVAAHLNRERLSADQQRIIRYIALMVIYVSSTADILIARLDQPWLPLVLAVLSVAGVMAGILLRVQSFLFLGVLFLLLAIAAMIQYASRQVQSIWPWAVAGIVLGAGIVTVFALFEKKREEMLRLVGGLKQWEK